MLVKLRQLQDAAGVADLTSDSRDFDENEGEFDEVGESASANNVIQSQRPSRNSEPIGVERQRLILPSNGNVGGTAIEIELHHRTTQARRQVNQLRDIIADISFQYSHVIRGSSRKSVRTAAQKRVKYLHNDLVLQARIYTRCRSRLIALGCDQRLLNVFRVLTRSDLKASTAILRPNVPGASSIQLSWIWQTGRWHIFQPDPQLGSQSNAAAVAVADADAANLLECSYIYSFTILMLIFVKLNVFIGCVRVHKKTDGMRKSSSSPTRCSGQYDTFFTRATCGKMLPEV